MKTLVVYQSKNGNTKRFAEEIAKRVKRIKGSATVKSIDETTSDDIRDCDMLFLGGRTVGRYFYGQKPDGDWVEFAKKLPLVNEKKTVLFTTYDITTGKVFQHMKSHLQPKGYHVVGSIKSNRGEFDYFSISVMKYVLDCNLWVVERDMRHRLAEVS